MAYLLFDLDGTLVDSSRGIKNAFRHTFTELGQPIPSDSELSSFIGPPLETTFEMLFDSSAMVQKAIQIFRDFYQKKGVYQVQLYTGIKPALSQLKQTHQLFVTTSKYEPMAKQMLADLEIDSYFTQIYGSNAERFHKADVIQACMKAYRLSKETTTIIGDTKFDMIGGKTSGISCLGALWGFGKVDDLLSSGADNLLERPQDLYDFFKSS